MPDIAPSSGDVVRTRVRNDGGPLPPQLPIDSTTSDLPSTTSAVPSSPPPTYEEVLAENRLVAAAQLARAASLETATSSDSAGASGGSDAGKPSVPRVNTAPVLLGHGAAVQIQHKSSKELYRAVAAQWGLTCKMSDKCRCFDCQGRYFDCEFEGGNGNEHDKGDGGLGATTPMFISEVMAGSACTLL